jgi:hypothetical protein
VSLPASRCHVCERPRDGWARDEGLRVAIRNGLIVPACHSCWFMWPDDHKASWPRGGFGDARSTWIASLTAGVRVEVSGDGLRLLPVAEKRAA